MARPRRVYPTQHAVRGAKGVTPSKRRGDSVPCPQCKAEPGDPCLTTEGVPYKNNARSVHHSRRRMAIRAENEERFG